MAMSKKCNFPVWPPSDLGEQDKTRMEISSKMKSMTTSEHGTSYRKDCPVFCFLVFADQGRLYAGFAGAGGS